MQITYHVEHEEGSDVYIAHCPVMKPVSVYGKTEREVETKMKEAIKLYLDKHPEVLKDLHTTNSIEM